MPKLQVIFRITLRYPLQMLEPPLPEIAVSYTDTGNTVRTLSPAYGIYTEGMQPLPSIEIRVERDISTEAGENTSWKNWRDLSIPQDAARMFWQLFESVRETQYLTTNVIAGYPVVSSEEIQNNPLVTRCDFEAYLDGKELVRSGLGGNPVIVIDKNSWSVASQRLDKGEEVLPHHSFALDAIYFSQHDPIRAVIMACAAWETALRYYLSNVAAKKDAAYEIAAKLNGIPMLYQFATKARGGDLFFGMQDTAGLLADQLERHKKIMQELPSWRNRLLHQGSRKLIPEGGALDAAFATLNAIEWLFA